MFSYSHIIRSGFITFGTLGVFYLIMVVFNSKSEDEIDKNEIEIRLGEVLDYFFSNEGTVNLDVFMTLAFTQSNRIVKFLIKS